MTRRTLVPDRQQLSLFESSPTIRPAVRGEPRPKPGPSRTRFLVLGSGSGGNSVLVEGSGGHLLIDAGFACRSLEQRMRSVGVEPRSVRAILLTHEHGDHCRGVARFVKRFQPTVYGTRRTFFGAALRGVAFREIHLERPLELLGLEVSAFPVPHDARDPVGYVIEDGAGARFGLASDLGCRTQRAWAALSDLDALVIESNHDPRMLEAGPYPYALKRRVASRRGHLSNQEAAEGMREILSERLHTVVAYHLSRTNNRPELAEEALATTLRAEGADAVDLVVSDQFSPSRWIQLSAAGACATPG